MNDDVLADQIDALLPQTQCRKCGYQGCKPYARAISAGLADINQCPPGGDRGIKKLADLLGRPAKPLNPAFGIERPRMVASINEADCIGCTKCLPPCPVDAIIGATKLLHTVLVQQCTGCELCIAPCPVDCITMESAATAEWTQENADQARQQFQAKNQRLARLESERIAKQKKQLAQFKQRL